MAPKKTKLKKILLMYLAKRQLDAHSNAKTLTKKKRRRWWIRPHNRQRENHGHFHILVKTLREEDRESHYRFLRMSPERFKHLHSLLKEYEQPQGTEKRGRAPISLEEKLTVTLHHLATGDSQQSEAFNFRLGRSTVCNIIRQTCELIWKALHKDYLKFPSTKQQWVEMSQEFLDEWDFPHVLGAVDGKHINIECPKYGGSTYYNYKGFHSTVLMAMCDAKYKFTYVDIGHYGRDNDASIFSQSQLYADFESNRLPIPPPTQIQGKEIPYYIIGDEIFALKPWLMKPYGGKGLTQAQSTFNYRLSRSRRTIENAFGILAARWRVFRRAIRADVATVDSIVRAAICLHNYLLCTENARYLPTGFADSRNGDGMVEGDWRQIVNDDQHPALSTPRRLSSRNYGFDAKDIRDHVKQYVVSEEGTARCPWQLNIVRSCGKRFGADQVHGNNHKTD